MEDNRQEALNKAKKAQQMMLIQAEMEKQMQPTVPEVQAGSISMQPAILPNPKPQGTVIGADIYSAGNVYPGISGSTKLAATWNPMMDPAAGQNLGRAGKELEGAEGTTSPVASGRVGIDLVS